MWIDLLENLPDGTCFVTHHLHDIWGFLAIQIARPPTLGLGDLRTAGRKALMDMVRNEVLLILRSVPGVKVSKNVQSYLRPTGCRTS